jgi:hypothetical protein
MTFISSPARLSANRRNALRSTGPKSLEGKAASSRNATTHGLTASQPLLPDEDPTEYEVLASALYERMAPEAGHEELLVADIVSLTWRLRRLECVEVALFALGLTGPVGKALAQAGDETNGVGVAFSSEAGGFALLSRYETTLAARLHRSLAHLERLQRSRGAGDDDLVVIAGGR